MSRTKWWLVSRLPCGPGPPPSAGAPPGGNGRGRGAPKRGAVILTSGSVMGAPDGGTIETARSYGVSRGPGGAKAGAPGSGGAGGRCVGHGGDRNRAAERQQSRYRQSRYAPRLALCRTRPVGLLGSGRSPLLGDPRCGLPKISAQPLSMLFGKE
jgi:hypothetical protein